jgi:ankyrin repeat protein
MQPSAALATFSTRDKAYITLSMAIYILSNNLANLDNGVQWLDHRDFFETLDFVFEKIPARHLQALLQSRLAGVRAAFGALLNISGVLQQHFTFKSLVEIGACNDWLAISAKGHEHLYHAVCMGLDDVIRKLLKSGCRPDKLVDFGPPRTPTTAIIEALERHDIKCVELLLKHCDVNNQFQFGRYLFITSFTFFIQKKCQVDDMLLGQGIKLFLDAGADINSLLDKDPYLDSYDTPMRLRWQDNRIWSVQDYLFCFRPGLFNEFAPSWTPPQASQPTRAGILTSLKSGPSMLNEYCNKLEQNIGWQYVSEYLELLVAEQLTGIGPWSSGPRSVSDLETVCALVDFGVSMDQVLNRAPCLLTDYMEGRRGKKCDMKVIQYLLDNHAIVDDRALQEAVRWHGTDLLATLLQNTTSIRQRGVDAVVEAATTNNFDAVNMLLDAGVDVNTDSVRNPTLFRYLDIQSAGLLEGCGGLRRSYDNLERREIFEDMFRKGALLRPGAPLAAWIRMGGGAGLVKEMLLRGVKIDAYWHNDMFVKTALQEAAERCNEELVLLLLENDANPNAHARGKDGKTALQAICNYYPRSSAVKAQQLSIIKLLLDSSAKVNAAPAQSGGLTALQLAAKHGNLEVTMLLLSCNPPADVNMPPCEYPESFDPCGNALDLAAQHGRLDVVKLLLNNDALSSCPGNTGYDGAIQGAEKKGWLAVADLIRQHAMAVSRSNTTRTNLTQPQRDWHEYGYDDYSDGYTTFDEDEEEDAEDNESAESREKEDSVAQVQIQTEAVEYPGTEHAAPEPGWVSDMEVDDSPEFDIGFSNLDGDMGSLYGLDYAPSTSHLNTAASGWGLGQ